MTRWSNCSAWPDSMCRGCRPMDDLPPGSSGCTGRGSPIWCMASSQLAAAAATRAGLPVHLLLDDLAMNDRRSRDLCDELESRIRTWVAFASGDDAKLSTRLYSEVLTEPYLAERGWSAITDYLNPRIGVLDFLVASKVISPLQYTINAEESVQALLRNAESLGAEKTAHAAAELAGIREADRIYPRSVAGRHGQLRHHVGRRG